MHFSRITGAVLYFVLACDRRYPYPSGLYGRQVGWDMMTSSNENIFRVTGHLCEEFTGTGEFPAQRPVTRSFGEAGDLRRYRAHYDVTVMNHVHDEADDKSLSAFHLSSADLPLIDCTATRYLVFLQSTEDRHILMQHFKDRIWPFESRSRICAIPEFETFFLRLSTISYGGFWHQKQVSREQLSNYII